MTIYTISIIRQSTARSIKVGDGDHDNDILCDADNMFQNVFAIMFYYYCRHRVMMLMLTSHQ